MRQRAIGEGWKRAGKKMRARAGNFKEQRKRGTRGRNKVRLVGQPDSGQPYYARRGGGRGTQGKRERKW